MSFQPNEPKNKNDDPFASLDNPQGETVPYTPPTYAPQQKKGPNTLLMILLGAAIATVCICGACIAIAGGSIASVVNNPTFQAGMGTALSIMDLPDTLPSSATEKGTIEANSTDSGNLETPFSNDVWTYQGKSGEQLTIRLDSNESGLNNIGIYDSEGKVLQKTKLVDANRQKNSSSLTYTLPSDGTYSILVGGVDGRYTLEVSSSR
jgi:hypothetical protein